MGAGSWSLVMDHIASRRCSWPATGVLEPLSANSGCGLDGIFTDPKLADPAGATVPRFEFAKGRFLSGSKSIRGEFERLVRAYGVPDREAVRGKADPGSMPGDDILGNKRDDSPDIGAFEFAQ